MGNEVMIESLYRDGFCKIEQVFSKDFIHQLRVECLRISDALPMQLRNKYRSQGSLVQLLDYPYFSTLIAHDNLFDCFQRLRFTDTVFSSGYLISKPPGGPPLFWHQDWWGWDHPSSYTSTIAQFFVMIYLQKTDKTNGCLRIIPGSHREPFEQLSSLDAHTDELSAYSDPQSIQFEDIDQGVAVEVEIGDIVVGDARLLHGAYANHSDLERSLLTLWYHPNYGDLPDSVRSAIWRMHNGIADGVDTPISEGGITAWPTSEKQMVLPITPRREEKAPLEWNRTPQWAKKLP